MTNQTEPSVHTIGGATNAIRKMLVKSSSKAVINAPPLKRST